MVPNDQVILDGPRTLTLQPNTIALILDALSDKPHKVVYGPINEILGQLRAPAGGQQHARAFEGAGDANGLPGEGNIKANGHDGGDRDTTG